MDADGRIIPIVEGDQGEGFKDEIDPQEDPSYTERVKEMAFKENQEKSQSQLQPQRIRMQLGMPINFHGYQYKVVKILNRGRIMLKLLGEIPEGR